VNHTEKEGRGELPRSKVEIICWQEHGRIKPATEEMGEWNKESFWDGFDRYEPTEPGKKNKYRERVRRMRERLEKGSVAPGTRKNYNYAIARYGRFIGQTEEMEKFKEWPANPWGVALHLEDIWDSKRSKAAMKMALYAVKWGHKVEGLEDPGKVQVISKLMKAAAMEMYELRNRKHTLKEGQVRDIIEIAMKEDEVGEGDRGMGFPCIIAQQFAGARRISEVFNTRRRYIVFTGRGMRIYYKGKNHAARGGEWTYYESQPEGVHCPVKMMREHLQGREILKLEKKSKRWDELIYQVKGKKVTYSGIRKRFIKIFKKLGLNPKLFGTHSIRSGACTAAIARGMPKWLVKRQGGWLSEAIDVYILPTERESYRVGAKLASLLKKKERR